MQNFIKKLQLVAVMACLTGCVGTAIMATGVLVGGSLVYDQRNLDEITTDQKIVNRLTDRYEDYGDILERVHLNMTVFNRVVLLTGQVDSESTLLTMVDIAEAQANVQKVINHMTVEPQSSYKDRGRDTLLTGYVKAALLDAQGLKSTQIKVLTENGVVYLLGEVTQKAHDLVLETVNATKHVDEVIDLLEISS